MFEFTDTQVSIINAFIKLIELKSFEHITISNILESAHISRSQFYRLFEDKYDLLAKTIVYQYFVSATDTVGNSLWYHRYDGAIKLYQEKKAILSKSHKFKTETLSHMLFNTIVDLYIQQHHLSYDYEITPDKMNAIRFAAAGYTTLLIDWLHSTNKTEDLRTMSCKVGEILPNIVLGMDFIKEEPDEEFMKARRARLEQLQKP